EAAGQFAAGLAQFGLQFLDHRLAQRVVDVHQGNAIEAALLDQVRHHGAHFEVDQGNGVPEIVAQLGQVGAHAAAVDHDRLAAGTDGRDSLRYAGESAEHERHLGHVDQLVHTDYTLHGQRLAVFVDDGQLARQHLGGIDVFDGQIGARTEDLAV